MANTRRVISAAQLKKMQDGAKAARKAKLKAGKACGDCGKKVRPREGSEPYIRSSTRPGVVYCWPGEGCWVTPSGKSRTRDEL